MGEISPLKFSLEQTKQWLYGYCISRGGACHLCFIVKLYMVVAGHSYLGIVTKFTELQGSPTQLTGYNNIFGCTNLMLVL